MEVLAEGDLTTAADEWLDGVVPDVNTTIRDRLATHYGTSGDAADLTSMWARFLRDRS